LAAVLFSLENPIVPCVPSQNGLLFDAPHLHNATPSTVEDFQQLWVPCHLGDSKVRCEEVIFLAFLLLFDLVVLH
jgi:hypothetical protein